MVGSKLQHRREHLLPTRGGHAGDGEDEVAGDVGEAGAASSAEDLNRLARGVGALEECQGRAIQALETEAEAVDTGLQPHLHLLGLG